MHDRIKMVVEQSRYANGHQNCAATAAHPVHVATGGLVLDMQLCSVVRALLTHVATGGLVLDMRNSCESFGTGDEHRQRAVARSKRPLQSYVVRRKEMFRSDCIQYLHTAVGKPDVQLC